MKPAWPVRWATSSLIWLTSSGQVGCSGPIATSGSARTRAPYKDHQGGYVEVGPACGYYVQVSSGGLMVGAGWYSPTTEQVARYRSAIDEGVHVPALRAELARLEKAGMEVGGDVVKTRPRGVPADHPDLDLMRHRTVLVSTSFAYDERWLGTRPAGTGVRNVWRRTRPLVEWLADNVTGHGED